MLTWALTEAQTAEVELVCHNQSTLLKLDIICLTELVTEQTTLLVSLCHLCLPLFELLWVRRLLLTEK